MLINQLQGRVEICRTIDKFGRLTQLYAEVDQNYNLILTTSVNAVYTHSKTFSLDLLDGMNDLIIDMLKDNLKKKSDKNV